MSQTASPAPADRFALIIEGLCHAVARRGGLSGLAGPFLILIWSRLRRIATRFTRHALIPPVPCRPAKPRPHRLRPSRPHLLPRRSAWLLRLAPETASGASQLRHFLADPDVASLLATSPHLRRVLRPLCHMLGIRPAYARPPSPLPPPDAAPAARPIPSHAPPQAAPAAFPPVACPPWTTPPPSSRAAPPVPA